MGRCIIEQKGSFLKEVRHCDQSRAKTREGCQERVTNRVYSIMKSHSEKRNHSGNSNGNGMDPLWKAMSKLRRGRLDECVEICNESLARHPNDQVDLSLII